MCMLDGIYLHYRYNYNTTSSYVIFMTQSFSPPISVSETFNHAFLIYKSIKISHFYTFLFQFNFYHCRHKKATIFLDYQLLPVVICLPCSYLARFLFLLNCPFIPFLRHDVTSDDIDFASLVIVHTANRDVYMKACWQSMNSKMNDKHH